MGHLNLTINPSAVEASINVELIFPADASQYDPMPAVKAEDMRREPK